MDTNTAIAWALGLVGMSDIAIARLLGNKLSTVARYGLTASGVVFLLASAAFATRMVRI